MIRRMLMTVGLLAGFTMAMALGASLTGNRSNSVLAQEQEKPMGELRHMVLFKFKADATKEQVQEVVDAFAAMPKKIDVITGFEWGTDVSTEGRSEGFTHCFVVTFKDAKGRDEYLPHPAHMEFVKLAIPRIEKVLVVDYFAKK